MEETCVQMFGQSRHPDRIEPSGQRVRGDRSPCFAHSHRRASAANRCFGPCPTDGNRHADADALAANEHTDAAC
jgi:hypothetical protein